MFIANTKNSARFARSVATGFLLLIRLRSLRRRPFRDFSEACSHKKTAREGRSCWLAIAAAKSCFACVNHRSASLSSRCAVLLCSWWSVWRTFPFWSAKQFCTYEFCLISKYIVVWGSTLVSLILIYFENSNFQQDLPK